MSSEIDMRELFRVCRRARGPRRRITLLWIVLILAWANGSSAQSLSSVIIFSEAGFPTADSATASSEQVLRMLPGARLASADQLGARLDDQATRLFVLPYGSAFPEAAWSDIYRFLRRGGNLLVLGGRPFTRSAYRDPAGWKLRDYSVRFTRPLMIDQYQVTPGSGGLEFQTNPDVPVRISPFSWKHGFSPVIHLSAVDLYGRQGSAGSIDARLDALAWGTKDSRKLIAPVVRVDHFRNGFNGGRWIFLNAELTPDFFTSPHTTTLIHHPPSTPNHSLHSFTSNPLLP